MPPTVIINVDGAIGMPQPPAGPNIPTELIPTVPPNRLNQSGFPSRKPGRLALPQQSVGFRDVDLHQTVDDVLSLRGGEQVGVAPANLEERPVWYPRPSPAVVSPSRAVAVCSARAFVIACATCTRTVDSYGD